MYEILIIVFLIIAIAIIGLVLIQKGKGADMGASFGAGASATLFGSAGTGSFLTRTTTILGILFFIISIALANLGSRKGSNDTFWNLADGTVPAATADAPLTNETPAASQNVVQPESTSPTSDIPE
ncbi:preprotein translocase subunit SecG [Orbus mooreae]|uniref:preprotein translocase subunit SecG n=1 Tax=Orbus mooreae TaxID=3074107 RepID=UPI00370DBC23